MRQSYGTAVRITGIIHEQLIVVFAGAISLLNAEMVGACIGNCIIL